VFSLGAATLPTAKRASTTTPQQADSEALLWEAAKDGNTIADYGTYLTQFPDGIFATMAKRRIGEITAKVKMKKSPGKLALSPIQKKPLSNQRRLQDGKPAAFPVNALINGWQEALPLIPVGEKWQLVIPPHHAYGKRGKGAIRPNETLLFYSLFSDGLPAHPSNLTKSPNVSINSFQTKPIKEAAND